MRLPLLPKTDNRSFLEIKLSGINCSDGQNALYDAVNLTKERLLKTRKGRSAVLFYDVPPDQIISCGDKIFHRFKNSLFEVITTDTGIIYGDEITLKDYSVPPKRHIVFWQNEYYILPDSVILGDEDEWFDFGAKNSPSVALPFLNGQALYYTFGQDGEEYCPQQDVLQVGTKVRFNWVGEKEFTVIARERVREMGSISTLEVGVRITLDKSVPYYTSLDSNSAMQYCIPKKRPIFNPFSCGLSCGCSFSKNEIYFNQYNDGKIYERNIENYLTVGQSVQISGSSEPKNNRIAVITEILSNSVVFDTSFVPLDEGKNTVITLTPILPEFDHLVFTEDRIFGADNGAGKLYVSKLKDPFIFTSAYTENEDSWWMMLNEKVRGMTLWKDNIICFTETGGFRVLGYHALNFGIRQLSLNGIAKGSDNSLVRLGDTLYYSSSGGVMKYSGGSDKKISAPLPKDVSITHSATDGKKIYMLSNDRIFVYDPNEDVWFSESNDGIKSIYYHNQKRFLCGEKALYLADSGDFSAAWSFETNPIFNTGFNIKPLFAELSAIGGKSTEFEVFIKLFGNSQAISVGKYTLKGEKTLRLPLNQVWCKQFSLKIVGSGDFSPYNLTICYRRKSL